MGMKTSSWRFATASTVSISLTITNVLNVANVGVQVQISGLNVNLGGLPLPTSFDETLANFNAQLPAFAPAGLDLVDSSLLGSLNFAITPFDDIDADGDLDPGDVLVIRLMYLSLYCLFHSFLLM